MVKKAHITTLVCLLICCALIVAACIIGYDFNAVGAGKGDGANAEVTSIEEVGDLIEAMFSQSSYPRRSSLAASDDGKDDKEDKEFTSMTVRITSSSYFSRKSNSGVFKTSTVQSDMFFAIMEDGLYYHVEYTATGDAKTSVAEDDEDDDDSKEYIDLAADFEMFISAEKLYMRINSVSEANNGKSSFAYERVIGEWGDFSDDMQKGMHIASSFTGVNSRIYDILNLVIDYINEYPETGFSKKGSSYMMKTDTFKQFAAQLMNKVGSSSDCLDEEFSGALEFDLDDSTKPVITLDFKNGYESVKDESNKDRFTVDVAETTVVEFSRINNTIIKGHDKVQALSAKDYTELMEETDER